MTNEKWLTFGPLPDDLVAQNREQPALIKEYAEQLLAEDNTPEEEESKRLRLYRDMTEEEITHFSAQTDIPVEEVKELQRFVGNRQPEE